MVTWGRRCIETGALILFFLFSGTIVSAATKQNSCPAESINNIKNYIREFCPDPGDSSSSSGFDIKGHVDVSPKEFLRNLANINGGAAVGWKSEKTAGVLQSQLVAAKKDKIDCNIKTLNILIQYYRSKMSNCLKISLNNEGNQSSSGRIIELQPEDIIYQPSSESTEDILRPFIRQRRGNINNDATWAANINCVISRSLRVTGCKVISDEPSGFGAHFVPILEKMIVRYYDAAGRPWAGRMCIFQLRYQRMS